jgi:hypothetical protein
MTVALMPVVLVPVVLMPVVLGPVVLGPVALMSVGFALVLVTVGFTLSGYVTLTVCCPLLGPVRSLPLGRVFPSVHTYEDEYDRQDNDAHEHDTAHAEAMSKPGPPDAEVERHYFAPAG